MVLHHADYTAKAIYVLHKYITMSTREANFGTHLRSVGIERARCKLDGRGRCLPCVYVHLSLETALAVDNSYGNYPISVSDGSVRSEVLLVGGAIWRRNQVFNGS